MTCESNTNEIVVLMPSNKCCLSLTASFSLFVSPPAEAVSRPDEETATAWLLLRMRLRWQRRCGDRERKSVGLGGTHRRRQGSKHRT
jgi:hypothetical protein